MNIKVKKLYDEFSKMSEKQILAFLGFYFNKKALENMATYFALDSLAEVDKLSDDDKADIETIKLQITRAKQIK